jgi:hypothetical protein
VTERNSISMGLFLELAGGFSSDNQAGKGAHLVVLWCLMHWCLTDDFYVIMLDLRQSRFEIGNVIVFEFTRAMVLD